MASESGKIDKQTGNRFAALDPDFIPVRSKKANKAAKRVVSSIPEMIRHQWSESQKYGYKYRVLQNGNVENQSTIYVCTGVAYHHQVEEIFSQAIADAKSMPEVFGKDFECDVKINLLRRNTGEYVGVAYIDVTNPAFYYALLGLNVDGSDRAEYYDDPSWVPPTEPIKCWADDVEVPKLRKELPPLIALSQYEYDEKQKAHLGTDESHGRITISPAFKPAAEENCDPKILFVQNVPSTNVAFLYAIFARYARTWPSEPTENTFYPKIHVKETRTGELVALVQYYHEFDAGFAMAMLRKVRALYNGEEITMPVRYARK